MKTRDRNKLINIAVIAVIAIICLGAAFCAADEIAVSAYAAPHIDAFFAGSAITSDGNTTIVASNHYYIEWNDLELVYDGNGKTPTVVLKCVEDPDFNVTGNISLLNSEGGDSTDNAGEGEQTQEPTEGGEQTEGTTDSADGNSQTDSVTSEMIDAGTYMVQVEFEGLTLAPEIDASKEFTILPCTVEVQWSAGDGAAEDPTGIFNYTYNGQAQGPEAYYMSVNNESVQIVDVSGLEENTKNSAYTAYVDANAAGENYILTNTTCPYTISPFSVAVQWKACATEEGFIIDGSIPEYEYNGYLQGPVAYYTSVSNVLIPIAVNGHEINVNTTDLTYTASIDRASIDSNYTLNADAIEEYTFRITPKATAVIWNAAESYTYDGEAQGPTATYESVNGEILSLPVIGLGTNAGSWTANVDTNAAGVNYTLTNTTCLYTISPFSVVVQWKACATEEGFIIDGSVPEYEYNGYLQGPVAYYTSVNNVLIPISVNGHEINANTSDLTYTASIDRTSIDSNFTLNANAVEEYTYKITPKATAVIWIAAESYTYDGEAQGPTATYESVNGEILSLPVIGLGTNAGSWTANVDTNAAGVNYTLTNTTCLYTISPFSVVVQWKACATEEGFIIDGSVPEYEYNGYSQGPVAYYTSVSNVLISIAVNGHEINANTSDLTYTASIDRASIDSNYTLNANAIEEYTFRITPKATAVIWNTAESYTYDGEAQGPTATYETVNGEALNLLVTGLGINAGSHIASVAEDAAGGNYVLTGLEYGYEIAKAVASIIWQGGSYTYNGQAQGPGASFNNVHGDIVYLTVSGLGTDAGSYTARVAEDAAGENYILTNLEYGYEIAKAVVNVNWSVADYYIDNDEVQGPHAYIVNESGEMIELFILNLGTESGEYVAEIDLSSVNPNFELSGELQKSYEIIPEKAFGNGGIALSVVLGAILLVILVLAIYFYMRRKSTAPTMPPGSYSDGEEENKYNSPRSKPKEWIHNQDSLYEDNIKLTRELKELKRTHDAFRMENEQLHQQQNQTEWKCDQLKEELSHSNAEIRRLASNNSQLLDEQSKVKSRLSSFDQMLDRLNALCHQAVSKRSKKFKDCSGPSTSPNVPSIDNIRLIEQNNNVNDVLDLLDQKIHQLNIIIMTQMDEHSRTIAALQNDLANQEKSLSDKEETLNKTSEELKALKERIAKIPNFYMHPIEDYFDDIDKAYKSAQGCDFDSSRPQYCYNAQREALERIMKLISIYRSQRR